MSTLQQLAKALEQWETQQLLGGEYDKLGAILSLQVHPDHQQSKVVAHV